jgi:hypothetical protein
MNLTSQNANELGRNLTSQNELGFLGNFLHRLTVEIFARLPRPARSLKSPRNVKKRFFSILDPKTKEKYSAMHVADVIRFQLEMKTYKEGGKCGLALLLFLLPTVPVLCLHALSNLLLYFLPIRNMNIRAKEFLQTT